jgi:ketosteroid isomerase-like protein
LDNIAGKANLDLLTAHGVIADDSTVASITSRWDRAVLAGVIRATVDPTMAAAEVEAGLRCPLWREAAIGRLDDGEKVHRRRRHVSGWEDAPERAEILNSNAIDWELARRTAQPPQLCAYVTDDLLGSLPNDLSGADRNGSGQLQLASSDRNNAFLIGPVPIRERTAVNMNGNGAICFAYRVRPKVGDGPLRRCFVFLGCALSEAINRVFRTI